MENPKRASWEETYFATQHEPQYLAGVARQIEEFGLDVAGRDVLDIGCGPGAYLHGLVKQNPRKIIGLDVSAYYTKRLTEMESGIRCLRASATDIPFADQSFDNILLLNILWHVRAPLALAEAKRVLRPGGLLWVSQNLPGYYWWKIRYRQGRGIRQYAVETLSSLKRVVEPAFGLRSSYTSRGRFVRALAPLRIEKETFIRGHGIPCQFVVLARKPD